MSNPRLVFLHDGGRIPSRTKRRHSSLFTTTTLCTSALSECELDRQVFELANASSDSDIDVDDVTELAQ